MMSLGRLMLAAAISATALASAHAIAKVMELAPKRTRDHLMVVNLSGRGDKDLESVAKHLGGRL